jgi:hypothetical protein
MAGRLMTVPVFLLSPPRSGSTLLRCVLDMHSEVRSPPELHLKYVDVTVSSADSRLSLDLLGYSDRELRYLLWDRLLYEELQASGKRMMVEKSPCNIDILDDLRRCWPDVVFILLIRNPAHVARSMIANFPGCDLTAATARLRRMDEVRDRLREHDPPSVRYEDLVADPADTVRRLCERLGLRYEPQMLDYGRIDHGPFRYGLGDWGERIRSGTITAAPTPGPAVTSPALVEIGRRWGYDEADL